MCCGSVHFDVNLSDLDKVCQVHFVLYVGKSFGFELCLFEDVFE